MTSKHPSWAWQAGAVDAARRGDPAALARWFAEHAPDATWRARLALEARDAATQRALLAECRPGPEHGAALAAVVRDDADAVRAAHAAGADWHAPVRAGLGSLSAVEVAAGLGHVAALGALGALGVELDRDGHESALGADARTPLSVALQYQRWDAARALLDAGARADMNEVVRYLPGAREPALLAQLFARGLTRARVHYALGLASTALTPADLTALEAQGVAVDGPVLASVLQSVAHVRRPAAEVVALAEALFRRVALPADGAVPDHDGHPIDLYAHALAMLPIDVAHAMVATGVTKRRLHVSLTAPDAERKRAWLAEGAPARVPGAPLGFDEFVALVDDLLTGAEIVAQWRERDGRVHFGPFALGVDGARVTAESGAVWRPDDTRCWHARSESPLGFREHAVMVEAREDGAVVHVLYTLRYNRRANGELDELTAGLAARLGKPTRQTQRFTSWLRGHERVSYAFGACHDGRFGDELEIELLDERHKGHVMRALRLAKL